MKNLCDSHYARLSLTGQFYRQYSTVAAVSCGFLVVFSSSSMVKIWSVTYCRDFEFDYELGTLIITTILYVQFFVYLPLEYLRLDRLLRIPLLDSFWGRTLTWNFIDLTPFFATRKRAHLFMRTWQNTVIFHQSVNIHVRFKNFLYSSKWSRLY